MQPSDIKFSSINVRSLHKRKFSKLVRMLQKSQKPASIINMQETWHGHNSGVLQDIQNAGYRLLHKPRVNPRPQRHERGGVACVCLDRRLTFGPINIRNNPSTFEYMVSRVQWRSSVCRVINVYRPGSKPAVKEFFTELEDVIRKVQYPKEDTVLVGDLNVAMNRRSTKVNAKHLTDLLHRRQLKQNVTCATHDKGGLLDVICSSNSSAVKVKAVPKLPSDHFS